MTHSTHPLRRRRLVQAGLAAVAAPWLGPVAAQAPDWPNRPIKLVVGFAAGGPTDAIGRVVAQALSARLGQQVVVENRGGAAGVIGVDAVANAPADGYTLGMLAVTSVVSEALNNKPFAPNRIAPISLLYDQYNVLVVNPAFPGMADVQNLQQLVALARAQPGKLNYTSAGHGSMGHLSMEWINSLAGVRMTHVAYKGAAPALTDVLGGQLGVMFGDSNSAAPHIASGKLRPIAVNYPQRATDLPQVATVAEQGFGAVSGVAWVMLFGPPGTPAPLVERLNRELRAVYANPEVAEKIRSYKVNPKTNTAEQARTMIATEYTAWKKVVVDNGIKSE